MDSSGIMRYAKANVNNSVTSNDVIYDNCCHLIIQNFWKFGAIKDREYLQMEAFIISKVFYINEMIFISFHQPNDST